MTRRPAKLRILRSHDVIEAINRAGDRILDPRQHAWQHSGSPWVATCSWCGRPRNEHISWIRRALSRLGRWRVMR